MVVAGVVEVEGRDWVMAARRARSVPMVESLVRRVWRSLARLELEAISVREGEFWEDER